MDQQRISRRRFLGLAGATSVIVVGGVVWRAADQGVFSAVRSLNDINQSLRAGRLWQRMHLWGTSENLAMQPHNEMPEVVDRERQLGLLPQTTEFFPASPVTTHGTRPSRFAWANLRWRRCPARADQLTRS